MLATRQRLSWHFPSICKPRLRPRRERPGGRRAAEQRDKIATFQLIEWHSAPASQGQIAGYRIDHSPSADLLNLINTAEASSGMMVYEERLQHAAFLVIDLV